MGKTRETLLSKFVDMLYYKRAKGGVHRFAPQMVVAVCVNVMY